MSKEHFEKHILPVSDKMYRYALSILKEAELAKDVVQECLTKIWSKRQNLSSIQSPEAWAMRITRNQCYDWVKMNRFTVLVENSFEKEDDRKADESVLVRDQLSWLNQVLETLPQKQREVFHLREVEDLSYQEMAEVLAISINEVKVNLHRARTKVKETIQKIDAYGIAN